jgi:hypothetical protein
MTILNHNPVYGATQKTATAKATSANAIANTDLDDTPSGAALLLTAPAGGCAVTRLTAQLVEPALTTACQLNLYLSKDGGTSMRRLKSAAHAAYTWAVTTAPAQDDFGYTESAPLRLEAADRLYVQVRAGSAVTDAFAFTAEYAELVPDA